MKKLTLLTFALISLAATCQEPDLHGYTIEYVDSLQSIIDSDTLFYNFENLSAEVYRTDNGLRFNFKDVDIDRRFHFIYDDRQRIIQLGDSLKGTSPFNLDFHDE